MNGENNSNGLSRRELIRLLGVGALAALAPTFLADSAEASTPGAHGFERGKGPGLIFVVGDGMPAGVTRAMQQIRTGILGAKGTALHARLRDPESSIGLMATASLSSIVTDSAPASAAWSTGVHTVNRRLAVLPDGRELTTIFELVKPRGVATGLVSTTRVTHATPAAWVSHKADRDDEDGIALDMVAFKPDVLLGGGRGHFDPKKRKDGKDLLAELTAAGFDSVADREALKGAPGVAKPLVGLFSSSHIPYYVDRLNDPTLAKVPTLAEMTAAALKRLSKNSGGFLLQVEAGRIDHANHANDAWSAIMDTVELDDTLAVIDEYLKVNPQTLVVVTSDHGTGGFGANGTGAEYNGATAALRAYGAGKASFEATIKRMKGKGAGEIRDLLAHMSGLTIRPEDAQMVFEAMQPDFRPFPGDFVYQPDGTMGRILADSYSGKGAQAISRGNVGFTSCNHTAEDQVLLVYGHGAKGLGLNRLVENTDLFATMCRHFGVSHKNPVMTAEQARPYLTASAETERSLRLHIA